MTMITKMRTGFAAAAASIVMAGVVVGPAPAAHASGGTTREFTVDIAGTWVEPVDKIKPGIRMYVQSLTLSRDGRFTWENGMVCNAALCPQVKRGINRGTYRIDGEKLTFDGNLFDATGKTFGDPNAIEVDGRHLVRDAS